METSEMLSIVLGEIIDKRKQVFGDGDGSMSKWIQEIS